MDNQKDEQEIMDTEEALRFIGKKYLYVCECNGEVKFFDRTRICIRTCAVLTGNKIRKI